jgi:hypothetical protein
VKLLVGHFSCPAWRVLWETRNPVEDREASPIRTWEHMAGRINHDTTTPTQDGITQPAAPVGRDPSGRFGLYVHLAGG